MPKYPSIIRVGLIKIIYALKKPKKVSWIVGKLVYEALIPTVKKLNLINGLTINLYGLPSIYWGQDQVVTGLLTGEDLIYGLKNKDLGDRPESQNACKSNRQPGNSIHVSQF